MFVMLAKLHCSRAAFWLQARSTSTSPMPNTTEATTTSTFENLITFLPVRVLLAVETGPKVPLCPLYHNAFAIISQFYLSHFPVFRTSSINILMPNDLLGPSKGTKTQLSPSIELSTEGLQF